MAEKRYTGETARDQTRTFFKKVGIGALCLGMVGGVTFEIVQKLTAPPTGISAWVTEVQHVTRTEGTAFVYVKNDDNTAQTITVTFQDQSCNSQGNGWGSVVPHVMKGQPGKVNYGSAIINLGKLKPGQSISTTVFLPEEVITQGQAVIDANGKNVDTPGWSLC